MRVRVCNKIPLQQWLDLKTWPKKKGGKMKFRCMSEKSWQEHRGEQWVEQQGDKEHDQEKEHPASVLKARRHFLST